MAKEYQFNWRPQIPEILLKGDVFDRYDDETTTLDVGCPVRFEEYGFYIVWEPKGKDAGVLDLLQVWEARGSGTIKDLRVKDLFDLEQRGAKEPVEERTVWITYSQDLVNVNSLYLVAKTAQIALDWRQAINSVVHNYKLGHACPTTCLTKHWRYLCLATNERGKIPLKNIIKTFSSGKPEKMVQKCLNDLGLAGDKFIVASRVRVPCSWSKVLGGLFWCNSKWREKQKERDELDANLFTFEKFIRLYHKICPRTDVQELFVKLSGQKEYLTREKLIHFLNEEQRDPRLNEILFPAFDNERVQQLISKYETDESYIAQGKMSGDGFLRFLMSDENSPVFLARTNLHQDMDQPLCHYYINSSHNTYLIGRQYGGKSSTEIYRQVLIAGCRCIELDCWDGTGENKGEPIITHGKAMCTDVFFKDVLYQIRDTAFARSDFPVILSFENHCSKSNQLKMAKYCMEIFGDLLLSKPLDDFALEPGVLLPSPNRLKRKILIKNKRLRPDVEKQQLEQFLREGKLDEDDEIGETPEVVGEDALPSHQDQRAHPEQDPNSQTPPLSADSKEFKDLDEAHPELKQQNFIQKLKPFSKKMTDGDQLMNCMDEAGGLGMLSVGGGGGLSREKSEKRSFRRNSGSQEHPMAALLDSTGPKRQTSTRQRSKKPVLTKEEEERIFAEYHYTGATTNIHPLLSTLINYTHPVKFSGFEYSEANNCHFHMSSFSESTGLGYLKASAPEFVNYNKRQLSRIYPKGARVDSSNFLPQIFWNAGCQMVALNFQTSDVCMQLNQGKFEYNGQSGYLLKPDFMRRPDRSFDPFSESPVDGVIAAHCSIRVISGQFLCDRKVGTYVEVEMYGLPTDTIRKEHRTKTVPANGLNPIYNEEPFVFRKVVLPELAVLRFAVYDENGKQLGQRIIPLDGLQAGYRHIGLRTETNMPTTLPTLFVHIVIKTYVPDELSGLVDALADPKAYLSAQEKRKEALHNMGVDESDIVEVPADTTNINDKVAQKQKSDPRLKLNGAASPLSQEHRQNSAFIPPQKDGSIKANETSENKFKVETINVTELRKDKCFQKLSKKLQKDMEELKKRHQKQRDTIQKQQQSTVDKMMSDSHKMSKKESKKNNLHNTNSGNGTSRHPSLSGRSSDSARSPSAISDMANNQKMRSLVSTQMDEWSKLIQKQQLEEFELRKAHINEEFDMLRRLLSDAQKQQMTALKTKLDNENKELKQSQTKKSMEDTKLIQQDKNIKTKAERDRRVKELNEKNVKVFVEERKRLAMKSQMHEEQLTKRHTEQVEILEKEASKTIELEDMNHRESLLATRPESVV